MNKINEKETHFINKMKSYAYVLSRLASNNKKEKRIFITGKGGCLYCWTFSLFVMIESNMRKWSLVKKIVIILFS